MLASQCNMVLKHDSHTLSQISHWNNLIFFNHWLLPIRIKNAFFLTVLSVTLYSYPPSPSLHPNSRFHRTSAVFCTDRLRVANERVELGFLTLKIGHYQIFENSSLERRECTSAFRRHGNTHCLISKFLHLCSSTE